MEERRENVMPFKPAWRADTRQSSSHRAVLVKNKEAQSIRKRILRFWSTSKRKRWKRERGKVVAILSQSLEREEEPAD